MSRALFDLAVRAAEHPSDLDSDEVRQLGQGVVYLLRQATHATNGKGSRLSDALHDVERVRRELDETVRALVKAAS